MLFKGFSGIGRIKRTDVDDSYVVFRFLNADYDLNQSTNFYLPTYSDENSKNRPAYSKNLRRIVSPSTGDVTGRVTLFLTESMASTWYTIASDCEFFDLELYFANGRARKFEETRMESLTFDCKASEMVQMSFETISKNHEKMDEGDAESFYAETSSKRTSVEKLVDWTKASTTMARSGDLASFSYSIKNNLIATKTTSSLLPSYITRGIQEVNGSIVVLDMANPNYVESPDVYEIFKENVTFSIDNWSVTHYIINHWSYRTPLSPETVMTTLEWARVDLLSDPS